MNGNVGTTWAASPTTLEERCMAATAMPGMLCDSIGHRTRKTCFRQRWNGKTDGTHCGTRTIKGIADALGDDASVVETVIADRERKLSGHVEPAWSVELRRF